VAMRETVRAIAGQLGQFEGLLRQLKDCQGYLFERLLVQSEGLVWQFAGLLELFEGLLWQSERLLG